MDDIWIDDRLHLRREIEHWDNAINRMRDIDSRWSPIALNSLEHYLGLSIRKRLLEAVDRLEKSSRELYLQYGKIQEPNEYNLLRRQLLNLRRQYSRTETTLDFYADALNTRSNEYMGQLMSACDALARKSMFEALSPLRRETPHVLTFIDKGLGASILKMGLRLWDGGTINPVAVIKVVYHNLMRPTSLIHEAGHQVAHILNWNAELAHCIRQSLLSYSIELADIWSSWASEIAADAFAFVYTGYAAVASLHDVLSLQRGFVFRFIPGDPHPISYLRVLLGIMMCQQTYGAGAWDSLQISWLKRYPHSSAPRELRQILQDSLTVLPTICRIILCQPMDAFNGRSIVELVDPMRVHPNALHHWEQEMGASLYQSSYWISNHALRLLALSGYKVAVEPQYMTRILRQQEAWMLKLGIRTETIH